MGPDRPPGGCTCSNAHAGSHVSTSPSTLAISCVCFSDHSHPTEVLAPLSVRDPFTSEPPHVTIDCS